MPWNEIEKYELKWNVKNHKGEINLIFKDDRQFPCPDLSHEDFSAMLDMLRDEKSRWFEDKHKILATGDKQPEPVEEKTEKPTNWDNAKSEEVEPSYSMPED